MWSEVEWHIARAVAAIHGVSGLLAQNLRWPGPPGWAAFLKEQRAQIAQRLPRITELLRELDSQARARGLALVALKGAVLHARGVYVPGERPMADVDLLVRESEAADAVQMLAELGFRAGTVTWKHRAFEIPDGQAETARLGEHSRRPHQGRAPYPDPRDPAPARCGRIAPRVSVAAACGRQRLRAQTLLCCCTYCCTPRGR